MRISRSLLLSSLLGITLAALAVAQTPIPTIALEERALGVPSTTVSAFPGISAVASNGKSFLIATSAQTISFGPYAALMLVDSAGHPAIDHSYLFSAGNAAGVASNGSDFLTVWGHFGETDAVRVSADGTLLDPNPIVIHIPTRTQFTSHDLGVSERSAAWDGSQWVVLTRIEQVQTTPNLRIDMFEIATLVGENGQVLQNDLEVNRGSNNALAARNGVSVIVWSDGGVFVRTLNGTGSLSDPIQVSAIASTANAIAAGDDGFLVVQSENGSTAVRAQHLDPGGRPDTPALTVSPTSTGAPSVTWAGTSYRVAWADGSNAIQSVRVNSRAIVDAPPVALASGQNPTLAFNGTSSLLTWSANDGSTRTRLADVAGTGQLVHSFVNPQSLNEIEFAAVGVSVAWTEVTSRLTNVSDGTSLPPISDGAYTLIRGLNRPLVVSGTVPPFTVRYADGSGQPFALPTRNPFWTGNGFLCLWTDDAPAGNSFQAMPLYAQRFEANGSPFDAVPRQIGTSFALSQNFTGAAALYNGVFAGASRSETLVAYVDMGASLQGILLNGGEIVDLGEIAPPQALANPIVIASDDEDFVVTWIGGMNGTNSYIGSRRVLANGDMPDPWRIDSPGNDTKDAMATFWTGLDYLVVWSKVGAPPADRYSAGRELVALRIGQDGKLIDYPPMGIGTVNGETIRFAYRDGLLAIAYQRDARVYSDFVVTPRRRIASR